MARPEREHEPRRRGPRGMTLIELMVASAIAAVIVSAATASVMAVYRSSRDAQMRASIDAEAKLLVEYLVSRIQPAGGGSFRPWSMVTVENDWNGDGSDRLILAELDTALGECTISSHNGSSVVYGFPDSPCCLDPVPTWDGRQVMVVSENGENTLSLTINNTTSSSGTCQANFTSWTASPLGQLNRLPGGDRSALVGGAMAVVKSKRFYVNKTTHELIMQQDTDNDGTWEDVVLADEVYDLQLALGYDSGTADGHITDTGSSTDEWLYNAPGDTMATINSTGADPTDLRMMAVGIIFGTRSTTMSGNPVKLLDGPQVTQPDRFLRGTIGRAMMRNLSLFDL